MTQLISTSAADGLSWEEVTGLVHLQAAYMLLELGNVADLSRFREAVLAHGTVSPEEFDIYLGQLLSMGWVRLKC